MWLGFLLDPVRTSDDPPDGLVLLTEPKLPGCLLPCDATAVGQTEPKPPGCLLPCDAAVVRQMSDETGDDPMLLRIPPDGQSWLDNEHLADLNSALVEVSADLFSARNDLATCATLLPSRVASRGDVGRGLTRQVPSRSKVDRSTAARPGFSGSRLADQEGPDREVADHGSTGPQRSSFDAIWTTEGCNVVTVSVNKRSGVRRQKETYGIDCPMESQTPRVGLSERGLDLKRTACPKGA